MTSLQRTQRASLNFGAWMTPWGRLVRWAQRPEWAAPHDVNQRQDLRESPSLPACVGR